jgi:hypothetical protein
MLDGVPLEYAGEKSRLVVHRAAMAEVFSEIAVQERDRDGQPFGRPDAIEHREACGRDHH